jgi:hypothetical protein
MREKYVTLNRDEDVRPTIGEDSSGISGAIE